MQEQYINIHTHNPTAKAIEPVAVGIHPYDANRQSVKQILPLLESADAIGEIGLDFVCDVAKDVQLSVFCEQLDLASERGLPVVLHCVRAFESIMQQLRGRALRAVIFHGFIGSKEQAERAVNSGYYLSFGESSLRSPRTVEALQSVPIDRIFVESDISLSPIEKIYELISKARGVSVSELIEATNASYRAIFYGNR